MISIITPHYNSSKEMEQLIGVLEKSNSSAYEWIIVDDCSKEEEYKQLKEALSNSKVNYKLIKNDVNCGAAESRNRGIKQSSGEYITFVDSDDLITEDFVTTINDNVNQSLDILFFDYFYRTKDNDNYKKTINLDYGEYDDNQLIWINSTTNVCCKVYKANIIKNNNIEFPSLKRYEDWVFYSKCIARAQKIKYINKALYYYVFSDSSIVHTNRNDVYKYSLKAYELIKDDLKDFNSDVLDAAYAREVLYVMTIEKINQLTKAEYIELLDQLLTERKCKQNNKYLKHFKLHHRVFVHLIISRQFWLIKLMLKVIK